MRILPWESRRKRKADIAEAEQLAAEARQQADEAAIIERDLRRMVAHNHFADYIQAAITGRRVRPDE